VLVVFDDELDVGDSEVTLLDVTEGGKGGKLWENSRETLIRLASSVHRDGGNLVPQNILL
jgi:hypothetical protein